MLDSIETVFLSSRWLAERFPNVDGDEKELDFVRILRGSTCVVGKRRNNLHELY